MDTKTIQSTLKLWVSTLTGIKPGLVLMENEPRPAIPTAAAFLSWVSIPSIGLAEDRESTNAEAATAILATGGVSATVQQVYQGAALNGTIGVGAISPAGFLELTFSQSASWDATTTVTVKGLDPVGAACIDTFAVTPGQVVGGSQLFSQVAEIDIPAQLGALGTFTVGTAESTSEGLLTNRTPAMQIGIESFTQDPAQNGFFLLEKLRGLMRGRASLAILATANLGLADMDATTKADYRVDNHFVSRAVASVRFNLSDTATDTQGTTGTVDAVQLTSDSILEEDGVTQAPAANQWTDHQIGPV